MIFRHLLNMRSHPTWVRGLKQKLLRFGVWSPLVAPYVGAWIETKDLTRVKPKVSSHPTWVRGLKQKTMPKSEFFQSRTLRGCVD